jgi:sortase A
VPRPARVALISALLVAGAVGAVVIDEARDAASASDGVTDLRRPTASQAESAPTRAATPQPTADAPSPATGAQAPGEETDRSTRPPDGARPDGARPADARSMVRATLRVPQIGLRRLVVVPYHGSPDDGPGTRIQNGGVAATPIGPRGGTGPGQVGNYIVTAHRTTSPAPFAELPSLRRGDHVLVRAAGRVYDYRVTGTRWTSFRSPASLRRQSADVPGRPGADATRAMITLSTCATPEDHARGNYWSDQFGNPEHRIDKIGVLVAVRPTGATRDDEAGGA